MKEYNNDYIYYDDNEDYLKRIPNDGLEELDIEPLDIDDM